MKRFVLPLVAAAALAIPAAANAELPADVQAAKIGRAHV